MEQIIISDQYNKVLSAFLESPDKAENIDLNLLQQLLEKYPYSQPLHFIHAAIQKDNPQFYDRYLPIASAYAPQREVLYNIVHHPEAFKFQPAISVETEEEISVETNFVTGNSIEPLLHFEEVEDIPDSDIAEVEDNRNVGLPEDARSDDPIFEAANIEQSLDVLRENEEVEPDTGSSNNSNIEAGEQKPQLDAPIENPTAEPGSLENSFEEEKLIGSIAGSDFFAFEQSAVDPFQDGQSKGQETLQTSHSTVSKYHDDQLPFTFLWWLDKTRKQHGENHQPYANFSLGQTRKIDQNVPAPELNHQIVENIFHLHTPLNTVDIQPNTIEFEVKRKENAIIEKFIVEDPQIRPSQPDKIDNENKARRSAEDPNDLVSETLANIYIDQMLYHKAISTYKKLSLKFPEKSPYFANQISELEKKIN